jgi:hypothetical protein
MPKTYFVTVEIPVTADSPEDAHSDVWEFLGPQSDPIDWVLGIREEGTNRRWTVHEAADGRFAIREEPA